MYTWSNEWTSEEGSEDEEIAECIGIPASESLICCKLGVTNDERTENFQLRDVKWAPDGKGLLLVDKDVFCCAFEVEQDDEDGV